MHSIANPGKVEGQKMNFMNEGNWEGYNKNGHEFPIINYWNKLGKPYDHFWSTGFGSFLPDRIYHTHISRGQRYVWHENGYRKGCLREQPSFFKQLLRNELKWSLLSSLTR